MHQLRFIAYRVLAFELVLAFKVVLAVGWMVLRSVRPSFAGQG